MSLVRCQDCGRHFERAADEAWKRFCVPCYKKSKRAESSPIDSYWKDRATAAEQQVESLRATVSNLVGQSLRQPPPSRLERELAENWRALVQLVHPDKHGGSQGATRLTQWLNDVKGRLPCG
jgi:hypothetical protein